LPVSNQFGSKQLADGREMLYCLFGRNTPGQQRP
jgi:hypothetical protein